MLVASYRLETRRTDGRSRARHVNPSRLLLVMNIYDIVFACFACFACYGAALI